MTTEQRLERLERKNRRMRRIVPVAFVVFAASLGISGLPLDIAVVATLGGYALSRRALGRSPVKRILGGATLVAVVMVVFAPWQVYERRTDVLWARNPLGDPLLIETDRKVGKWEPGWISHEAVWSAPWRPKARRVSPPPAMGGATTIHETRGHLVWWGLGLRLASLALLAGVLAVWSLRRTSPTPAEQAPR